MIDTTLVEWIEGQDKAAPGTLADFPLSATRNEAFRSLVERMIATDWTAAGKLAASLHYRLVAVREGETVFHAAADASGTGRDPIVILNPNAEIDLIASAPHAPNEAGTAQQAALLVSQRGARAAIIAGAHRCAAATFVSCDGRTSICGQQERYRTSDVAHNPESLFHTAHRVLAEAWPKAVVLSLHGMKTDKDGVQTSVILSSGIKQADPERALPATRLRLSLAKLLRRPGAVVDCELAKDSRFGFRKLCGYNNVQGRLVNGDDDVCRGSVTSGTGRFIHIEQDWAVRKPFARDWKAVDANSMMGGFLDAVASIAPTIN